MKTSIVIAGILTLIVLMSCEKDCLVCPECDLEHLGQNSIWGEKVKKDLSSLFLDIEDIALVRVYNTTGDVTHWSGYDAGDPLKDSRQIQVDFLDTELMLVWKRFAEGKWTHSVIRINYDDINVTVLQYVSFIKGGQVVRRANNVLFFVSDHFDPLKLDGSEANAVSPDGLNETYSVEIFRKNSHPAL